MCRQTAPPLFTLCRGGARAFAAMSSSSKKKTSISSLRSGDAVRLGRRAPREPARALPGASLSAYTPLKGLPTGWLSVVYDDGAT